MAAALMTPLMPGAGPPPTSRASLPLLAALLIDLLASDLVSPAPRRGGRHRGPEPPGTAAAGFARPVPDGWKGNSWAPQSNSRDGGAGRLPPRPGSLLVGVKGARRCPHGAAASCLAQRQGRPALCAH